MAYQDTLFQLGMDLTRSSTAQKEDHAKTARIARKVGPVSDHRSDVGRLPERDGPGAAGRHLIIDLFGATRLDDAEHIERALRRCAEVAGATLSHVHLDRSAARDVSGFAVLDRGHVSIHTHPGTGFAALDVFLRGATDMTPCVEVLEKAFSASRVALKQHQRGNARPSVQPAANNALRSPLPGAKARSRVRKAA
jgi:S-adenosylmethionine decarboxylase